MTINIDEQSGFCFGVVTAIKKAEEELKTEGSLFCLGDIVHNGSEVARLESMGLKTIDHKRFKTLYKAKILLRAHGEPPTTYQLAKQNDLTLIDATCPVVLQLQKKIKKEYDEAGKDTQIVIFGKKGHAEVNGLVGQTNNTAIVIENNDDLNLLDYDKNITLFSQTTKSLDEFNNIISEIEKRINISHSFKFNDTICRQVANRIPNIRKFAGSNDIILFVSGAKSSNGKILFQECEKVNQRSYHIQQPDDIQSEWLSGDIETIGICGATSTPKWLMEQVGKKIKQLTER